MNDVIKRFTLDLQRPSSNEVVYAKGGDTGRKIVVSLTDGGRPYQISADCYAVFTGKKSSGKILNDCTVENNAVVYTITPQNVAAAEKIPCEIRLYNKNNKVITSARFTMIVEQPVNDGNDLTPSEEVEALTKLIGESLNAIDNANGAAEELRTARENGEFDGPKGDPGPEGPQGEPGPAGPAGPAGAGRLDVTRNGNKASHNAMEIYEHTEKGGQVFFEGMQLRYADGSIAMFRHDTTLGDLPYLFGSIRIFENGDMYIFSGNLPYLDDDAVHHTSTWSSHKIAKELNAKAPIILQNRTPTKHTSGDYEGQLCVCIMGDEWSIPTAELYIYSGSRAFDDTSPLEHYWEKVGDGGGGGIFTFRINCGDGFDYNYIYSDKSLSEIQKSFWDKKFVLALVYDETPGNMVSASVYLDSFEGEEGTVYVTTGSIPNSEFTYVYKGDVATNTWTVQKISGGLGDVEAALDAIIKIQNSLIGGGSV